MSSNLIRKSFVSIHVGVSCSIVLEKGLFSWLTVGPAVTRQIPMFSTILNKLRMHVSEILTVLLIFVFKMPRDFVVAFKINKVNN